MENKITCPVSVDKVNETVVRAVALMVVVIAGITLFFHWYMLAFLLAFDFSIRAFSDGSYSLLRRIAISIVKALNLKNRPVDAAPKKFAAAMGVVFSIIIGVSLAFGWGIAAIVSGATLIFCAFLEGALGICLGCIVYSYTKWMHR